MKKILDSKLFAQKTYGKVLAVKRNQCGMTQEEFARQNYIHIHTLQNFEAGKRFPSHEYRIMFSDALKFPLLRSRPPYIDVSRELITSRFNAQSISSEYFVDCRDNTLKQLVASYKSGYDDGTRHGNLDAKSYYDHCLHQLILGFYPDPYERELFQHTQLQHITYFREWAIHLDFPEFLERPDNIGNHLKLFAVCLSGKPQDIQEVLQTHSEGSWHDVDMLLSHFKMV